MTKKTLLITVIASLGLFSPAFAEEGECKDGCKGKRGMGHRLSDEQKAEILKKFDKDGDGELSKEERKTAFEAKKEEFMDKFDTDGDGTLSDEEKEAAKSERLDKVFSEIDKDGDGQVSKEEFASAQKKMMDKRKGGKKEDKTE